MYLFITQVLGYFLLFFSIILLGKRELVALLKEDSKIESK